MKVADVLKTAEWTAHLEGMIRKMELMRMKALEQARKADSKPVRMPIDYFIENDLLTAEKVTQMYLDVMEKKSDLSAIQRMFIMESGMATFNETMRDFVKDHPELSKK